MYDLNQMIIFAHVVNEQSFSAASRKLGMTKSSVSKAVAKLEHALGASLLNRSTRHLSLTEIGASFYDYCTRIRDEAEEAQQMIESLNAQPRACLKWLPQWLLAPCMLRLPLRSLWIDTRSWKLT